VAGASISRLPASEAISFDRRMKSSGEHAHRRAGLRAGDWVEVRSKEEILGTLDRNGRLDELPFMPEMFPYCGRRFRVWKRAHKTCDTVNKTGGRRMTSAVHLEELRCDGSAHGGCQAACLIFWKEAWLKPIADPAVASGCSSGVAGGELPEGHVHAATRAAGESDSQNPTYVCQATLLPLATTPLAWWDFRQYLEDYTSGNTSLPQILSGAIYVCYYRLVRFVGRRSQRAARGLIRLYDRVQSVVGGTPYPRRWGTIAAGQKTPTRPLGLTAGDLVQVRSYDEILTTLDVHNRNRGLYFDAEEVPYCGKTFRVLSKVVNLIDEKTGKMLTLKDQNVILDGAICQARYSDRRMGCPRAIYSIWRETWLQPAPETAHQAAPDRPREVSDQNRLRRLQ
jgi:hypothetical protein